MSDVWVLTSGNTWEEGNEETIIDIFSSKQKGIDYCKDKSMGDIDINNTNEYGSNYHLTEWSVN